MGKKYVVMIDGSVHSTKAATLCAKLCKKGDEVHLYTSIPRISYHIPKSQHVHGHHTWLQDAAKLFAGKELSELKLKMDVVTDVRADLVDFAKARKPDTVFMGSRGLGEFKGVWGSASQYVLHHYEEGSICVVRDYDVAAHAADGGNKPLHFLLAADGSEHSKRAIAHLGQVATPEDAVTTFAALDSPPQFYPVLPVMATEAVAVQWKDNKVYETELEATKKKAQEIADLAKAALLEGNKELKADNVTACSATDYNGVAKLIIDKANQKESPVDIVVMGTRGLGLVKRMVMGSVSNEILHSLDNKACLIVH
eukprot:TRINITY_DN59698_c0_g1_i1.p1 TRINITY_DN59698_c0_g1~~TRINITY_DN59698_c0_g1_i1.p1  ORF type:complete len:311 (-),score=39.38 TRINITY_DN59698_c0_g1_i1:86-1018(-)